MGIPLLAGGRDCGKIQTGLKDLDLRQNTPTDVVTLILGEHAAILALFRGLENRLASMSLEEMRHAAEWVEYLMRNHAVEEDSLLFSALPQAQRGVADTLEAMHGEHEEQRILLEGMHDINDAAPARAQMRRLIEVTREHFAVEERVLFGLARGLLGAERLSELGREFCRRRGIACAE